MNVLQNCANCFILNQSPLVLQFSDCPYGAVCQTEIRSKANFWAEEHDGEVYMHICPEEYCCQAETCLPYATCADHRLVKWRAFMFVCRKKAERVVVSQY